MPFDCSLHRALGHIKAYPKNDRLLVHLCLHRRIFMFLVQEIYTWRESLQVGQKYRLPSSVREELLFMILCLPCMHANIRWPVSSRVGATDASSTGGERAATHNFECGSRFIQIQRACWRTSSTGLVNWSLASSAQHHATTTF